MSEAATVRLRAGPLEAWTRMAFESKGVSSTVAGVTADVLVRASLRGIDTHGVSMVPLYLHRLETGAIVAEAEVEVVQESPATAVLTGNGGLGQYVASRASELAVDKARTAGVAAVTVRSSSHFGAAGSFALQIAEQGFIGVVCTNGPLSIQIPGTLGAGMSSGTRAYGVPHTPPIVFDMSVAPSGTKILDAGRRGERVPEGWVVDAEGEPTTDPRAYLAGGARVPIGAHKGFGLALINELVAGALSGAATPWEIGPAPGPDDRRWELGHLILALDVEHFGPRVVFENAVAAIVDGLDRAPGVEGTARAYVPGMRAAHEEEHRRQNGIPIQPDVWFSLLDAAHEARLSAELEAAIA